MASHLVHHQHHALGALLRRQGCQPLVEASQQHFVVALAAGAVLRIVQAGGVDVRDAIAHALAAARLVVDPQHRQARALQHVQQVLRIAVAVQEGVAREAGEHAGHGGRGAGAAGPGVAEGCHLRAGEFRRRVARIAVHPEVAGAPRFAQHQHQQPRMAGGGGDLRVHADRQQRARTVLAADSDFGHRVDRIERVQQVAQLLVVAHGRRERLEAGQHQHHREADAHHDAARVAQRLLLPGVVPHRRPPDQPRGQHGAHQDGQRQPGREQGQRLVPVGLQRVGRHAAVDHDVVGPHEVAAQGRGQQQHDDRGLQQRTPREQAQDGEQDRGDHAGQREGQQPAPVGLQQAQGIQLAPQGHVAGGGHPGARAGDQGCGGTFPRLTILHAPIFLPPGARRPGAATRRNP